MDFIVDTLLKAFCIQFGMILAGNILPIFLHAFFGVPYTIL